MTSGRYVSSPTSSFSWREEINSIREPFSLSTISFGKIRVPEWLLLASFGLSSLALGYMLGRYADSNGGTDG